METWTTNFKIYGGVRSGESRRQMNKKGMLLRKMHF
jgi:hypothetical protein